MPLRRRKRFWILPIGAVVTVLCAAHARLASTHSGLLDRIDAALAPVAGALRIFGLQVVSPGLAGPFKRQFYVTQIGIAVWGAIVCAASMAVMVWRGDATITDTEFSIAKLMRERGLNSRQAVLKMHALLVGVFLPLTLMSIVVFLNALRGWLPLSAKADDWIVLTFFTVMLVYLTGAMTLPLCWVLAAWLLRDIRSLYKSITVS